MTTQEIQALCEKYVINSYRPRKMALVRGQGCTVVDAEGKEYLDFLAGIAVTVLGHCHPAVTEAICAQAHTLLHVSNVYFIEPQVRLAALLSENSFAKKWFFCNSGAEANEAAMKLARRYWFVKGTPRPEIIAAHRSFHGRTFGALTITGQSQYQEGFEPLLPGVHYVPYNHAEALEDALSPQVGAVILESIKGEGGVRGPSDNYFREVRQLCDERKVLLILDEVQTGMGRTGKLFCHEHYGITPDIVTMAKGLANGVPIGAMGCTDEVASGFTPGTHASTFGGNPLSSAAALATLSEVLKPEFLEHVTAMGQYFLTALRAMVGRHQGIIDVRGRGLMIGMEMSEPVAPIMDELLNAGIICGSAGPNVLRFTPPLIVTREQIDRVIMALDTLLGDR